VSEMATVVAVRTDPDGRRVAFLKTDGRTRERLRLPERLVRRGRRRLVVGSRVAFTRQGKGIGLADVLFPPLRGVR
jgi:hypothetical protein